MLQTIDYTDQTGKVSSRRVAQLENYTRIHIQVKGAISISISQERSTLEQPPGGLTFGGLEITPQMGIVTLWWIGPMYAIGTANGAQFNMEIMPCAC